MGTLKSNVIEPATGTNLTLGASGDLIDVTSDAIQLNTWKDSGGNTLFTSDGSGNLSSINSALDLAAGPVLILSQTASDSATLEFTSDIDSTYDHYMITWYDVRPETNWANFTFQANAAGASGYNETMTTSIIRCYNLDNNQSSGNLFQDTGESQANGTSFQLLAEQLADLKIQANESAYGLAAASGILHLYGPSSTTYAKQFILRTQNYYAGYGTNDLHIAGYFNTTLAIDEIQFKMSSGNMNGVFKLYGIK